MIDRNYPNPNWNDGTAPHPKRDNTFDKIVPNSTVLVVFLESYPGQPGWKFPYEQTTKFAPGPGCSKADYVNVPVNSKTAHPPLGQSPGIWLRTVGNLTQNEVRPVGHLTFVSKRLLAVGSKRISQFFDSASEPRSPVIAIVDSPWVFLLLSFYIVLSWNMPLFKVWSEDKLNKKFVVAENFAELVSTVCFTCLESGGFDPLWSSNGWGIWPSKLAT